ncbi:restriction endonuclease [Acidithiobacillus thiooxidans]|uniref:restriction endonuclease n=1 Tax=Acidithiobacillus TaxID=119977 RepID=UPI0002624C09|nr:MULTISPECIES: restriction endonuclease [Acidithiobacillus]MBU2741350.1 restriction endonuclease [Acidithiobacillus albertensis]MBU2812041.1 restriction endonuclease [Acidithiobacillus thiooxidans]MBU2834999.1 restriction endonuclease [Acidithiobacillus thiooxidans]
MFPLQRLLAFGKAWMAQWQSRRKASHRYRQQAAVHRYDTLAGIQGKNAGETFARRIAYLRKLDPLVFEELVLDGFKRKGFIVELGTRYSGDGGLDGKVFRDNHWIGIQCKRYKGTIQTAHVEQFARDLSKFGLTEGYFVHTGKTPKGLRSCYGQITFLSGQELIDFLVQVHSIKS